MVMVDIPKSHPRYESLMVREKLVSGFRDGAVACEGLIAQGRGEAFDYILGERTHDAALKAIEAAAAVLLLAKKPVISVNGNAAALVARDIVRLSELLSCPVEVNLFYRTREREEAVRKILADGGASFVLGVGDDASEKIPGLEHERGRVSASGIFCADVVLVPLEDGDRTEALCAMGKTVVTVDLSPFSRSAQAADVTIVDNIVRCYPLLCSEIERLKGFDGAQLREIVDGFDNRKNLSLMFVAMRERLSLAACGGGLDG